MKQIFAQFDADGDGKLDIYEIARAFRAMGTYRIELVTCNTCCYTCADATHVIP